MHLSFLTAERKKRAKKYFFALLPSLLFLTAAILLLSLFLPPAPVWITDNGNKYMMMRHFAQTGKLFFAPENPPLFPLGGFHFVPMPDGGIQSFFSWFLPVITSPFYSLLGEHGVCFWSAAGTLGILLILGFQRKKRMIAWGLFLGSPLLFYSLLLWEMTPSIVFAMAGWLLLLKRRYFLAGVLLGGGIWFREELYFFSAAFAIAMLMRKEWKGVLLCTAGALLTVLPLWALNREICGHFLGLHGSRYAMNNNPEAHGLLPQANIGAVVFNFNQHLFRFDLPGSAAFPFGLTASLLLLAGGAAAAERKRFKTILLLLYSLDIAIAVFFLFRTDNPLYTAAATAGLIPAIPLAAGFFLNWRSLAESRRRKISMTALALLLYLLCVPIFLTISDIGLTWGPRHFFCVLPPLLYLSFYTLKQIALSRKWQFSLFALLFGLSLLIQVWGMLALVHVARVNSAAETELIARPEKIVVTDLFYLPEETPRLFFEKEFCEVLNDADLDTLSRHMAEKGDSSFVLLLSTEPGMRRMSNETLLKLTGRFSQGETKRLFVAPALEIFVTRFTAKPEKEKRP